MSFCLFSIMPLTFFVLTLTATKKDYIFIAQIVGVIYLLLGLCALAQFFIFPEQFNGRATYPLANPNSFSALLSLGFFCSVGWLLSVEKDKRKSLIALSLAIVLFGGVVAGGSRGALFALVPSILLMLVVLRAQVQVQYKYIIALTIGCGLVFYLTSFGINENQNLFNRVVEAQGTDLNSYSNNRLSLWKASFEMIKSYGLWGTGFGTYFLYFPEFRLREDILGTFYAHNDPIQYWVELGFLGPVLFYGFIILVIARTIKACKNTIEPKQRLLILTPFFALGACMIHTHVTFNLYNLSILFMVGLLLAVWFYATAEVLQDKTKDIGLKNCPKPMRCVLISLPFIMIGGMFSAYILGEYYTNKARDYLIAGEMEAFSSHVIFAQNIGLNGNYRPYLLAVNVPLGLLEETEEKIDEAKRQELTKFAFGYIDHVQHINPRSSSALFYMGKLIQIGEAEPLPDDLKPASFYYAQALKIDPLHVGARLALAEIYEKEGQSDLALSTLEQGGDYIYISSNAINLYAALAKYYLNNGDATKRDEFLKKMLELQQRIQTRSVPKWQGLGKIIGGE